MSIMDLQRKKFYMGGASADDGHAGEMGGKGFGGGYSDDHGEGISDAGARRALANNASLRAGVNNAASIKAEQAKDAKAKQEAIQRDLDARRGKTPIGYSYGKVKISPYDFSKKAPGAIQFGIIPTALNLAKKFATYKKDREIRARLGLDLVDEIEMDMPNAPFGRSRVNTNEGGGDGNPYILPQYAMMGGGADMGSEDVEEEKTYDYRFGDDQDVIYENYGTPGYRNTRAEGGIMGTRARRAMGGIMERVDKRQGYFLGKLVKKVGNAAKKVLSSDIGKAAIAGAAIYYGGGGRMPFTDAFKADGFGGFKAFGEGSFFSKANPLLFSDNKFNPLKFAGLTTLIGAGMGPAKQDPSLMATRSDTQLIDPLTGEEATPAEMRENIELAKLEAGDDADKLAAIDAKYNNMLNLQYQAGLPDATPYNLYGSRGYRTTVATGGRIGFNGGGTTITLMDGTKVQIPAGSYNSSGSLKDRIYSSSKGDLLREEIVRKLSFANGGRIGRAEGGLMDLGGMEKDYRAEGGFVPIGEYEKKDDVPARLSVNEFVFTADAVRGAGQGDIDKGAEIMENMMENLENGGTVSEESQGNKGAQNMFKTSERLGAVI